MTAPSYTAATVRAMQAKGRFNVAYRMAVAAWLYSAAHGLSFGERLSAAWYCFYKNLGRTS